MMSTTGIDERMREAHAQRKTPLPGRWMLDVGRGMFNSAPLKSPFRRRMSRSPLPPAAGHSGFTLIEVLVSVTILSIGIVVVLQALQSAAVAASEARASLRTMTLTSAKLAEAEEAIQRGEMPPTRESGVFPSPFDAYFWERRVSEAESSVVGDVPGRLLEVSVLVGREGVSGGRETVTWLRLEEDEDEE